MTLLDDLLSIKGWVENTLGFDLRDEDFADGWEKAEHILLTEVCHAAVSHSVPWLRALDDQAYTAVDELMAGFLAVEIAERLGLFAQGTTAFSEALQRFPLAFSPEDYQHLRALWEEYFWPCKDLEGMATYAAAFLRDGETIYHILPKDDWEQAQSAGAYQPVSLAEQGFIHCSKVNQVVRVANSYYGACSDLVLLCIAVNQVSVKIKHEDLLGEGESFPHIYGPLVLASVASASPLERDAKGQFVLPAGLSALSI